MTTWDGFFCEFHQAKTTSSAIDKHQYSWISLSPVPVKGTWFDRRSCFAFSRGTGDWADSLLDATSFIPLALLGLLACSPPVYLSIAGDSKCQIGVISCATKKSWTAYSHNKSTTQSLSHAQFINVAITQSVGRSSRAATILVLNNKPRLVVGVLEPLSTLVAVLKIFKNSNTFAIVFHSSSLQILSNNRKCARRRSTSCWLINRLYPSWTTNSSLWLGSPSSM